MNFIGVNQPSGAEIWAERRDRRTDGDHLISQPSFFLRKVCGVYVCVCVCVWGGGGGGGGGRVNNSGVFSVTRTKQEVARISPDMTSWWAS